MFKFIPYLLLFALTGCDNPVVTNMGGLAPITFSGSIWAGNVRYAKVQFVGVDQYGQAQRNSAGNYYGDAHYSNDAGQFEGSIQGAYSGSLLAVASFADYEVVTQAATDNQAEVKESRSTQIRCVLPNGCATESSQMVDYGDWYDASPDFQMWSATSSIDGLESFHISPITHMAAQLAFTDFVTDGSLCLAGSNGLDGTCEGWLGVNGIFTPDSIYQANFKLKEFLLLNTGLHTNIASWYEGIEGTDDVHNVEIAKHGLMSMALQQMAKDNLKTTMNTLNWWLASFLSHKGNFYKNALADYPNEVDLKNLYQAAIHVATDYSNNEKSTPALATAAASYTAELPNLVDKELLDYTEVAYNQGTATKIAEAQQLILKVQGWVTGLEQHQYDVFFDGDVASEITSIETKWAGFNQTITPILKDLFQPLAKFSEYGLLCIRSNDGSCDVGHDLDGMIDFNAEENQITLNGIDQNISLDSKVYGYSNIRMKGRFEDGLTEGAIQRVFSFTEVFIETSNGLIEVKEEDSVLPKIIFWLEEELLSGVDPKIKRIDLLIPRLDVKSKKPSGLFEDVYFSGDDIALTMLGTRDASKGINSDVHFNVLSTAIQGEVIDSAGNGADSLDVGLIINSSNADTYYAPQKYPDIEMNIDPLAFKQYAQFSDADDFILNQGGWFTTPSDVVYDMLDSNNNEVLSDAVSFIDHGIYEQWDSEEYNELKTFLNLAYPETARLGSLKYPGGETALLLFNNESEDQSDKARQCIKASNIWACYDAQEVASLGCGIEYGNDTSTMLEAMSFLKDQGCIAQVKIDGRGIYDINYSAGELINNETFNIKLNEPVYLGIDSFNVRVLSRFKDGAGVERPVAMLNVLGSAPDLDDVSVAMSITHGYQGYGSYSTLGLLDLVPFGDNTVWFALGQSSDDTDALVYYIQDGSITLALSAFEYTADDNNKDHEKPFGVIRYDGHLLGSIRKEGDLYVIRYIDGSWQLL